MPTKKARKTPKSSKVLRKANKIEATKPLIVSPRDAAIGLTS